MPTTTNYSWTTPTPGGDTGVWDTILNTAFDDIDADLFALESSVGVNLARMLAPAGPVGNGNGWTGPSSSSLVSVCGNVATAGDLLIPLLGLKPGMRITGFRSRGSRDGTATAVVSLNHLNDDGTTTVDDAGHSLGTVEGMVETTGLTIDVVADKAYYIAVNPGGTGTCYVVHVALDLGVTP